MILPTKLQPMSFGEAKLLRDLCRAIGYTQSRLREESQLLVPPPDRVAPEMVAAIAEGTSPFHVFAKLFFLGRPVNESAVNDCIPESVVGLLVRSGTLDREDGEFRPRVLMVPVGGTLFASDLQRIDSVGDERYVSTLCDAALNLAMVAIPEPVDRTLDLCSGFALHSVLASSFSGQVIASDLNPRAVEFARFNAALNECDNITPVVGSLFDAVEGQRFDLILSNPPFIITPDTSTTYRSNPLELDAFVEQLISQVPAHLEEGGFFQCICEWVEFEGQDWVERLSGWFRDNGCDVWILTANRQLPASYATTAIQDLVEDRREFAAKVSSWEQHLKELGVAAIHGGFVFLRKRDGDNWMDVTQLADVLQRPVGAAVRQGFVNRDLMFEQDGGRQLLESSLEVSDGLRQVERSHWDEYRWKRDSIQLHVENGVPATVNIDEYVRTLIGTFDRQRSVRECIDVFAREVGLPDETATEQGLVLIRSMLKNGVLNVKQP